MASASGYNHHRFARAVLKKSRKWESSLTVQLFQGHWRFENSPVNFQYDGDMKPFLLALRSQVIPASLIRFLYDIQPPISFVDGCLVVEIQDFRRVPDVRSRVVMRPAAETLAQTIDVMLERKGQNVDEGMGLELESRIIAATSPPLYLGTSILATRNATLALALTSPAGTNLSSDGTLRSANGVGESGGPGGEGKTSLDRMRKLLRAGINDNKSIIGSSTSAGVGSGSGIQFQPNWNVLRAKEQYERLKQQRELELREAANRPQIPIPPPNQSTDPNGDTNNNTLQNTNADGTTTAANGGGNTTGEKKKVKKKRPPPPPVEEEEVEEKPKAKKKKKANAESKIEVETKEENDVPPPVKKKKKDTAKVPEVVEAPPVKKKGNKKKKDDSAATGEGKAAKNDSTAGGDALPLGVGLT